jgi:hypothetical protein
MLAGGEPGDGDPILRSSWSSLTGRLSKNLFISVRSATESRCQAEGPTQKTNIPKIVNLTSALMAESR